MEMKMRANGSLKKWLVILIRKNKNDAKLSFEKI